jgi:hypothetical protein
MVVAHTNDFGIGPARPIFDIRHHITDRSIHLHAILIALVTTYLIRFIYGSAIGAISVLLLARWVPFHPKDVATVITATAILSMFLWDHFVDLIESLLHWFSIIK